MKTKLLVLFILILFILETNAQKIHVSFPEFANNPYSLVLYFGEKEFVALSGELDQLGEASFKLGKNASQYTGLAELKLNDSTKIKLILHGESYSLTSLSKKPNITNIQFKNSSENQYLQNPVEMKDAKHPYSVNFIKLKNQIDSIKNFKQLSDIEIENFRNHGLDRIDMDMLYSSSLWTEFMDSWTQLEHEKVKNDTYFIKDSRKLMVACRTPMILNEFMNSLILRCNQNSWNYIKDETVGIVYQSGALHKPYGLVQEAMKPMGVQLNDEAPNFIIDSTKATKISSYRGSRILLFFYETGCPHCEAQLPILIENYKKLKSRGVEIISIAGDYLPEIYLIAAKSFPWKIKLRDPEHDIFIPYGVTGTPTYILINEEGKVKGRYTTLKRSHLLE